MSRYQNIKLITFCATSIFSLTPKRNDVELKSNIKIETRRLRLAESFKEANDSEENLFQKQSIFTPTSKLNDETIVIKPADKEEAV